jgi:hypothetical protein
MITPHADQSMSPGSKPMGKRLILTGLAPGSFHSAKQDRS